MTAKLLIGKEIAGSIRESLLAEVKGVSSLKLATIRVGDYEDAQLYANSIDRRLQKFGIKYDAKELSSDSTKGQLLDLIKTLSTDQTLTGILLLSPLPTHLNYSDIVENIPIELDAEGTRYAQSNDYKAYPPTALALFEAIKYAKQDLTGDHAVVIGRSKIVGRPIAELLLGANATVTQCHSKTKDLEGHIRQADIVVAAVGRANIIKGSWLKSSAIVVDAGENMLDGELCGDVEFIAAQDRCAFLTPVPGGIGPITPLMLIKNLLTLAKKNS